MTRDSFTLVLDIWIVIQLVWVTMLCAVQLVQVSRNQTTYENMRGHHIDRSYPSSQAFASAMAAGTTSLEGAGLTASGAGPNPAIPRPGQPRWRHGFCAQWSSLLGIETFFATYKLLEPKQTEVLGWHDAAFAWQLIEACRKRYAKDRSSD